MIDFGLDDIEHCERAITPQSVRRQAGPLVSDGVTFADVFYISPKTKVTPLKEWTNIFRTTVDFDAILNYRAQKPQPPPRRPPKSKCGKATILKTPTKKAAPKSKCGKATILKTPTKHGAPKTGICPKKTAKVVFLKTPTKDGAPRTGIYNFIQWLFGMQVIMII